MRRLVVVLVVLALALVGWEYYQSNQASKIATNPVVTKQVVERAANQVASNTEVQKETIKKASKKVSEDFVVKKEAAHEAAVLLHKDTEVRKDTVNQASELLHKDKEVREQVVVESTMLLATDPEVKADAAERTANKLQADVPFREQAATKTAEVCCEEKKAPPQASGYKVNGNFNGGGGTSSSQHFRVTGTIGGTAPATPAPAPAKVSSTLCMAPQPAKSLCGSYPPRWVNVTPQLEGEEVLLSMPDCAELVDVVLWDDARGIKARNLGPASRFPLDRFAGFNFRWRERGGDGSVFSQMITPQSGALLEGTGLTVGNCNNNCGWKYLRP